MNKVTVTYYGMEGTGRTVSEAKKDAGAKIEKALKGYYTPLILRHDGEMALVARDPFQGWGYRLIHADSTETKEQVYLNTGIWSQEDCIRSAFHHMAQNAGHYRGIESKLNDSQKRDLDSYFRWQDDYKRLRSEGLSDTDAHRMASSEVRV